MPYDTGTVSVANGATAVTGIGTAFGTPDPGSAFPLDGSNVKAGDTLWLADKLVHVAAVVSNTALTLRKPWTGATQTAQPYYIEPTGPGWHSNVPVNQTLAEIVNRLKGEGIWTPFYHEFDGVSAVINTDVHIGENSVVLSLNGVPQVPATDYTTGDRTITMTSLPAAGDVASGFVAGASVSAVGADGIVPARVWTFNNGIADADPTPGRFRFNNAALVSVTKVWIDNVDADGNAATAFLDSLDDNNNSNHRGYLSFRSLSDRAVFAEFVVTGSVVDKTGYRELTVAHVGSAGTFAGDFAVAFSRTGQIPSLGAALDAIAALTPAANKGLRFTGSSAAALHDFYPMQLLTPAQGVTWHSTSNPQPVLGNGVLTAWVTKIGGFQWTRIDLSIGSTTTLGTGTWFFRLPAPFDGLAQSPCWGTGHALDAAIQHYNFEAAVNQGTRDLYGLENSISMGPTHPFAFGTGDGCDLTIGYVVP